MPLLQEARPGLHAASHASPGQLAFRPDSRKLALTALDALGIVATGVITALMFGATLTDRVGSLGFAFAVTVLYLVMAHACGLYSKARISLAGDDVKSIYLVWIFTFCCLTPLALPLGIFATPRAVILILFAAGPLALVMIRLIMRRISVRCSLSDMTDDRQVVVVTQDDRPIPAGLSQKIRSSGRHVCRTVSLPVALDDGEFVGLLGQIVDYVRRYPVDEILLIPGRSEATVMGRILYCLRVVPQPIILIPEPAIDALLKKPAMEIGSLTAIQLRQAPLTRPQVTVKRLLDILAGTLALLAVLPALVAIAALIRLNSPGPILFRQRRIGLNGRSFYIFKFRTMTTLDDGPVVRQASRGDDRVTSVGRVLRKFSLDELPQLFNVLRGEMSLVGPRPHALAHDTEYSQAIELYAARHNVKPGITGWAQVNGWRGPTPHLDLMIRRLEHDLWYVDNWSLWLDIKIMLLTIKRASNSQNAF